MLIDQYLAYTQNVVTEMEELVKEIITVSKLDSMDELMEMSSINLSSLVNSYVLRNEKLAESKQIRITSLIEENIFIVADQNLMRKVVSNIINNAIFHSPAAALIEVNLKQKNSGEAQLIITNSGVTIPEDLLPEIFEPFKRVERSISWMTSRIQRSFKSNIIKYTSMHFFF